MRAQRSLLMFLVISGVTLLVLSCAPKRKNYMVHLEPRDVDGSTSSVELWHHYFLPEAAPQSAGGGDSDGPRIIYSYSHVWTGFAVRLTEKEVEGYLRLCLEVFLPLVTTHSPRFLSLHHGRKKR